MTLGETKRIISRIMLKLNGQFHLFHTLKLAGGTRQRLGEDEWRHFNWQCLPKVCLFVLFICHWLVVQSLFWTASMVITSEATVTAWACNHLTPELPSYQPLMRKKKHFSIDRIIKYRYELWGHSYDWTVMTLGHNMARIGLQCKVSQSLAM